MTDLIEARDAITDAVDRALSLAAKAAGEHLHQLDALKARVAELEARVAELEAEGRVCAAEPEPGRRVVRTTWRGNPAMLQPVFGDAADNPRCSHAVKHALSQLWTLYYPDGQPVETATEAEAIAWCLDGTLPKPVDGPVDLG